MFFLVCFDIVDDRVRYRVVKVLQSYGVRVQKSVFECSGLTEERFLKMKHRIAALIDEGEDSVRYYLLCRHCLRRIEYSGVRRLTDTTSFRVV